MDTRNVIAAISLSAAVIILYGLFFAPPRPDPKQVTNNDQNKNNLQLNEAPKIVSGLDVKTFITSEELSISKFNSHPKDFPIQFACINLTFSGHPFNFFKSSKRLSENLVILKNH